jgi:hypothetical protein
MRYRIVLAISLLVASEVAFTLFARSTALSAGHSASPAQLAGIIVSLTAMLASFSFLIYLAVSGAPGKDLLDRRYWYKWELPFLTFCWLFWVFDGIREARTNGWWWPATLAGLPIFLLAAGLAVRITRRMKNQGPPRGVSPTFD